MLGFLREWKESIQKCPGNFCKGDKARMFISWQPMKGIEMNIAALPEILDFYYQRVLNMSKLSVSVRILWRSILVAKEN